MIKKLVGFALIIVVLFCSGCEFIRNNLEEAFLSALDYGFEKEEAAREKRRAENKPIRGRDTLMIWCDMYHLLKSLNGAGLTLHEGRDVLHVLSCINNYSVHDKSLYIISDYGYAIIDENGYGDVFLTVPDTGCWTDTSGHKHTVYWYEDSDYLNYLSSFDEFNESQKDVFKNMPPKDINRLTD